VGHVTREVGKPWMISMHAYMNVWLTHDGMIWYLLDIPMDDTSGLGGRITTTDRPGPTIEEIVVVVEAGTMMDKMDEWLDQKVEGE